MITIDTSPAALLALVDDLNNIDASGSLTGPEISAIANAARSLRALAAAQPAPAARDNPFGAGGSCPVCGGDCSAANPPVHDCPLQRPAARDGDDRPDDGYPPHIPNAKTKAALREARDGDEALREALTTAVVTEIVRQDRDKERSGLRFDGYIEGWAIAKACLPLIAAREAAVRDQAIRARAGAFEAAAIIADRTAPLVAKAIRALASMPDTALSPAPIAAETPDVASDAGTVSEWHELFSGYWVDMRDATFRVQIHQKNEPKAEPVASLHEREEKANALSPIAAETPAVASDVRELSVEARNVIHEVEDMFPAPDESVGSTPFADWYQRLWQALAAIPSPAPSPAQADVDAAVGAEREACERIARGYRELWSNAGGFGGHSAGARIIADAIRARGTGEAL